MKTFISDLIPKLKRFSQELDNLTLLSNQHWVVVDNISNNKNVYIFRTNNELLISQNGKVEKARWEYLGNNSLLIDRKDNSYLFKHGFFDENILALKVDSKNEYAFLINENQYDGELNSVEKVIDFLTKKYIEPQLRENIEEITGISVTSVKAKIEGQSKLIQYHTDKGILEIDQGRNSYPDGCVAYMNEQKAPDGKYKIGFMWYVNIKDGKVIKVSLF